MLVYINEMLVLMIVSSPMIIIKEMKNKTKMEMTKADTVLEGKNTPVTASFIYIKIKIYSLFLFIYCTDIIDIVCNEKAIFTTV